MLVLAEPRWVTCISILYLGTIGLVMCSRLHVCVFCVTCARGGIVKNGELFRSARARLERQRMYEKFAIKHSGTQWIL